jgi:predicted AAA+ superfamily ATPase
MEKLIKRDAEKTLKHLTSKFPVIAVVGPRQSGKTTLVKKVFPKRRYVSLETPDIRSFALNDPRAFLKTYRQGSIIDEIQRVPDLLSYIQTIVDEKDAPGGYIITGSQNFLLHEKISQTLAGRVALLTLLPLSLSELQETRYKMKKSWDYIIKGFYPRVYSKNIAPGEWFSNYIQTYIERDIRLLKNITDIDTFQRFIKLCAGRTGQILNYSSLANDCGISHNTARAWLSILETSYIIFKVQPYYKNFNKRIIKMPKIYFYDTGILSFLLGIKNAHQIELHYLKGALFETFVIAEIYKFYLNKGFHPDLYYWHDKTGHEIDLIIEQGNKTFAIEIKSAETIVGDFFTGIKYWNSISHNFSKNNFIIYNGNTEQERDNIKIINWQNLSEIPLK